MNTNKSQTEQLPQDAVMQSVLKASDLRIGNIIYFIICDKEDSKLDEYKEITVDITDFEFIRDNNSLFEGIPLTKELLLKYGFIQEENEYFFKNDTLLISIGVCFYVLSNLGSGEARIKTRNLKYLHQLQNLYFALTNKELNYETTTI